MNKSLIVRKSKDSNIYVAYGYILTLGNHYRMIHAEGLTFSEAINNLLNYFN